MKLKPKPEPEQRYTVESSDSLGVHIVDTHTGIIDVRHIATTEQAIRKRNELEREHERRKEGER